MLVDCHAHLHADEFDADRDAVRVRAYDAGVRAVLVVGEDVADGERVLSACERSVPGTISVCGRLDC